MERCVVAVRCGCFGSVDAWVVGVEEVVAFCFGGDVVAAVVGDSVDEWAEVVISTVVDTHVGATPFSIDEDVPFFGCGLEI